MVSTSGALKGSAPPSVDAASADIAPVWHQLSSAESMRRLGVDPGRGLSSAEVAQRGEKYGPNRLTASAKEPRWKAFLRQYQDFMQIVLVVSGVITYVAIQDIGTAVVLIGLTIFNAIIGLQQEGKAEESVAALTKMLRVEARIRRNSEIQQIPSEELVPGDIVLFEAGDRVPADGRLLLTATLEIEEAALTGESTAVSKDVAPIDRAEVPLGDRINMAYMNTTVTRGRGEMVVTATGMATEVGRISGMLQTTKTEKTPLQKQLDQLSLIIAGMAGAALVLMVVLGLFRGEEFSTLFVTGIALAIAAVPTGLPAVVTTILTIGTTELARLGAIVKRLTAVETLGSTSAICSDKTGTLTMNQMTASELMIAGNRYTVSGRGYGISGKIEYVGGIGESKLDAYLLPMILCADAVVRDENLVGDPTEGALVVLAAKGGLSVEATRAAYPRIAEVPFDADYKLMATFHNMLNDQGEAVVRCYIKGAPDVLVKRAAYLRGAEGASIPIDTVRERILAENERMASQGLRVLIVAEKDFAPDTFDPAANLLTHITDLTLLAMVGIIDPPRQEVKVAIAQCKEAGIQVRMITGDHAVTAAAIARELGIEGRAITGAEFGHMDDPTAQQQVDDIGVFARVAPEHKVKLVRTLQAKNNIVAMTGDGVNDAPALKAANIGVAMGITGTEVTKEAAVMILTDDNFATIVKAVEMGRILYDNLMKFIRFQMGNLAAYILTFVGASLFFIAGGTPFNPLQILWINFFIEVPLAIGLGLDTPTPGLMQQKPRPADERVISRSLAIRLLLVGLFVAIGTLGVMQWASGVYDALVATTMGMTVFSLFRIVFAYNTRDPNGSVFRRTTFSSPKLLWTAGIALLLTILATEMRLTQRILETTALNGMQWGICLIIAVSLLIVAEIVKFFTRQAQEG